MIKITLDKVRTVDLLPNAVADAEEYLQMGLVKMCSDDQMGVRVIRGLLWAGMKKEDRSLTPEKTGRLIEDYMGQGKTIADLQVEVMRALQSNGWIEVIAKEQQELEE